MIQQKQAFRHNPDNGVYGDCFRTAVACLMELPRDDVPHVFHDGAPGPEADRRMNEWLRERGFVQVCMQLQGMSLQDALGTVVNMSAGNEQIEYLLSGTSRNGTGHVVVCKGKEIAWDPALDDSGIVGPADDGFWWVTVIAVCCPKTGVA